jgi:RNA polymerase sigma-70 factor (ECF subfamily)
LFTADGEAAATARRDVEKLLARLPEAKRRLVREVKLEGRAIADISAETGLSESAVKVTVHRALKSIADDVGASDADR